MPSYVLALDQGTTSTRSILFRPDLSVAAVTRREFPQHFPASGWVEHEPEDLWRTTVETIKGVLAKASATASDIAAIGITNQRETTLIWDKKSGKAIHKAIVWQDRRTADHCAALKAAGRQSVFARKTRLLLDPYFSGTKIAWLLDNVEGARRKAEAPKAHFRHRRYISSLAPDQQQGPCDGCHQRVAHAHLRHTSRPMGRGVVRAAASPQVAAARGAQFIGRLRQDQSLRCTAHPFRSRALPAISKRQRSDKHALHPA